MIKKRCKYCGEEFALPHVFLEDIIYFSSGEFRGWWHIDCFYKSKFESGMPENKIRTVIQKRIPKTAKHITKAVAQDDLYQLMRDYYGIAVVPNHMFIKLDRIYKGLYKNSGVPIPPEDLLDMLIQKRDYLDRIAQKKNMSGMARFNYDLAVVMAHYGSYLEWKNKKLVETARQSAERNTTPIDYNAIQAVSNNSTSDSDLTVDVGEILNDLWNTEVH